jgi:hypothetical protein
MEPACVAGDVLADDALGDRLLTRSHCNYLHFTLSQLGGGGRVEMSLLAGEDAAPRIQATVV